jgi:hypothetical protein
MYSYFRRHWKEYLLSDHAAIVAGNTSFISGDCDGSFIGAGILNKITDADNAVIVGGNQNLVKSVQSFIGGGISNQIANPDSVNCVIVGGYSNVVDGTYTSIVGTNNRSIGNYSFVGAGLNNHATGGANIWQKQFIGRLRHRWKSFKFCNYR